MTGIHHPEGDDTQGEQENSSPGEGAPKKSTQAGNEAMEGNEEFDDNISNSPPKNVHFYEDYAEDDDQYSSDIEKYFHEYKDMGEKTEQNPENKESNPDADENLNLDPANSRPTSS